MPGGSRRGCGRKPIEIDLGELEKLCALQCTDTEIAAWFGVSPRTIERRRKRAEVREVMERGNAKGRVSLRRSLWRLANAGNAANIFLAKNLLGYRDLGNDDPFADAPRQITVRYVNDPPSRSRPLSTPSKLSCSTRSSPITPGASTPQPWSSSWRGSQPRGPLNKALVHRYRTELLAKGLGAVSINHRLTALRKLAAEAADNGLLDPHLAAGISRVRGLRPPGRRLGNWLTRVQAGQPLDLPDTRTLRGKRDRALLAVLLGCGLRRTEAALLRCKQIQLRQGRRVIVDLVGKGQRLRSVAMPGWGKAALDSWTTAAAITTGLLFRPVSKADRVAGPAMSSHAIYAVVRRYTRQLRWLIAPHDLRRAHAKLAFSGGARLEQIQLALGHASVHTTERYLGLEQDWADAPCDHLGLRLRRNTKA